ncbi:MAG: hypothetical protein U1C53_01515 [Candidatus Veblenbacteria bacterium]|nr:hypothetical protein [Candidatus Veblenbacteria bacterium]MDZ4229793.1 hypothetical protein [Candidatus Veblenbacteria bacterium]
MPDGISDKQLKWGYWWVLHRELVRHIVEVGLGIVALALCGYALWQVTDWLANRRAEEDALRQIVNREINIEEYRRTNTPLALEIGTVTAVPIARGLYDLVAEVKNPNLKWAMRDVPFTFTADGQSVQGSTFFLPLESKYVAKLGVPLRVQPRQVSLSFDKVSWQRIRDLSTLSLPSFNVLNQSIEQVTPADAGGPTATRLRFGLENTSPFSFWQVGVTVVLTKSGSVQAVGQQVLSDVTSQSTREVEFYWSETIITADNLVVRPEVNVLDARVLK